RSPPEMTGAGAILLRSCGSLQAVLRPPELSDVATDSCTTMVPPEVVTDDVVGVLFDSAPGQTRDGQPAAAQNR
uniref:hypothetical protein n=1 Tax=Escherichia coli TaxID=562 RepID=UPI00321A3184